MPYKLIKKTLAGKRNGSKAKKLWPALKIKNYHKINFKEGLTFGGNSLTFGFDLSIFDPLRSFTASPKIWMIFNLKKKF